LSEFGQILFIFYGLLFGARHALEPDHLAAVSTMAAHGRSRREVLRVAAAWGAGHTVLIAAIGVGLILLPWLPPPWLDAWGEGLVGLLMVAMGCYVLWNVRSGSIHIHTHKHQNETTQHTHFHLHRSHAGHSSHPAEPRWMRSTLAAFLLGSVHGLAGSGAAIALAVAAAPSTALAVLYLILLGLGSIVGMAAAGVLALWPIVQFSTQSLAAQRLVQTVTGGASLVIGSILLWGTVA
jgi:hypothetical protein